MRLWSLHPQHLDAKGLVALWRKTLLAQKVLLGATRGYRNHPQLSRFKNHSDPLAAIAAYLNEVLCEAQRRDRRLGSGGSAGVSPACRRDACVPMVTILPAAVL